MYEQFGANEDGTTRKARFRLFIPDVSLDNTAPPQYERGGLPRIKNVYAVGNFQSQMPNGTDWEPSADTLLLPSLFTDTDGRKKGVLYERTTSPLPTGFYEYKYWIEYENPDHTAHFVTDPCTRYAGTANQNGGFVIDGVPDFIVPSLGADRKPYKDLVIYEIMIDDFTRAIKQDGEAPLAAIARKLDYLQSLGVNAIELMPWTAWPSDQFSWGYLPYLYFAVAHRYTLDEQDPTKKLVHLKQLIAECHRRQMHVLMDGVFAHVDIAGAGQGFPYYWLYQDPADSPYVDSIGASDYGKRLDYENRCTLEFVRDACIYWIENYQIDGIRFDETSGFFPGMGSGQGFASLLSELRAYLSEKGIPNFGLALEHTWDYAAVGFTNDVGATSSWFYPFFFTCHNALEQRAPDTKLMRALNSGFDYQPGRSPTLFLENHDHRTFIVKAGSRDEWWRTQPYAMALFTSPGAILLHNGQEFSQFENVPDLGEETPGNGRAQERPLQWNLRDDGPGGSTFALYQKLISLRENHAGLRSPNFYPAFWEEQRATLDNEGFGIDLSRQIVVFHRWGTAEDGGLERFYIVLNFSQSDQQVEVQVAENGEYEDLMSGWKPQAVNNRIPVRVGSNWGHVFYHKS